MRRATWTGAKSTHRDSFTKTDETGSGVAAIKGGLTSAAAAPLGSLRGVSEVARKWNANTTRMTMR